MIIAIGGQKGGTGKTTTTVALADAWHKAGKSVLLIDADPQRSAMTWGDVRAEVGLDSPSIIAMGEAMHKRDQLPRLAHGFDVVLIDCPPRFGKILRSAMMVADLVVMPCGPSDVDAWALAETLDLVEEAQTLREDLRSAVLITRKVPRTTIGRTARELLAEGGHPVLKTELGYRVAYQKCMGYGQGPATFDQNGKAARETHKLIAELELLMNEEEATHVA